jgi:16S rRNA (adenine1518-N6/adenine1519-N6)-dimethyltransferase
MNVSRLRELLDEHGLRLSRDLGQNFLIDTDLADELARRAGASEGDLVFEVGTGLGVLTRALAARAARVRTVEIDSGLVRVLRRQLLDLSEGLEDWSVMLQSEVAERLVAETGSRAYGSLTVLHRLVADVDLIATVSPERFFPRPKVDSSFVRIWPRANGPLLPGELVRVERLVRAAFSQRRKRVTNGLDRIAEKSWPGLDKRARRERLEALLGSVGLDPGLRPERIEPEAWLALSRQLEADLVDGGEDPDSVAADG